MTKLDDLLTTLFLLSKRLYLLCACSGFADSQTCTFRQSHHVYGSASGHFLFFCARLRIV
jgi:hypothetical protein